MREARAKKRSDAPRLISTIRARLYFSVDAGFASPSPAPVPVRVFCIDGSLLRGCGDHRPTGRQKEPPQVLSPSVQEAPGHPRETVPEESFMKLAALPRQRTMHQLRWSSILAGVLLVATIEPVDARLDAGGVMSRDLAKGTFRGVETIYATTQQDGASGNRLTLWAFCADGTCVAAGAAGDVVENGTYCKPPCKWRRPVNLQGDSSYAPPVVSADGTRVFF